MKHLNQIGILSITVLFLIGCTKQPKDSIKLFAAAGTRCATEEITAAFEKETRQAVSINFASSGTLARQIASGAKADIFISANKQWMDFLKDKGLIQDHEIKTMAYNKIVIISSRKIQAPSLPLDQEEVIFSENLKMAIGDPNHVPAGKYAKAFLKEAGWWSILQNRLIRARDVSSVLNYVVSKEVDYGIVYYSETKQSNNIKIVYEIPHNHYPKICFYIATLKNTPDKADRLIQYILSPKGQQILQNKGFITPENRQ